MIETGIKTRFRSMLRETLGHESLFEADFFSVYPYMFDPKQLVFLTGCVAATAQLLGSCVEIGCNRGATTVFLNKWMKGSGIAKRYVAIDTFSGFPEEHAEYEITHRNKESRIKVAFRGNKRSWVERSLRLAGVEDVDLIEADAAKFDYSSLKPIAFCLLDVDLYIPTSVALPKIYENLASGGIIVVDDCSVADPRWDGALQAYSEFTRSTCLPSNIVCDKLGIIEKH
jgi:Macrocin-O-methyltransferase (TylF)